MSGLAEQTEETRDQVDVVGLTEEGGPGEEDCDEELIQAEDSFVMGQCEDEQVQIENTASPEPCNDSTADERHSRPQRERRAPRLFTYDHLGTPTCYNTSCSGEVQQFQNMPYCGQQTFPPWPSPAPFYNPYSYLAYGYQR